MAIVFSRVTPTEIVIETGDSGICVCKDFLSPTEVGSLQSDFDSVYASGAFHKAGVGQGSAQEVRDLIRNDETFWLEPQTNDVVQKALLERCDQLKSAFNRTLFLGLNEFEGHYAQYSAGGFYQRHLDSFSGDQSRMVSIVIYLNRNWQTGDGGELRVFTGDSHIDVEPIAGTLVAFMSRETEHEVLASRVPRRSFSGWFKRPS